MKNTKLCGDEPLASPTPGKRCPEPHHALPTFYPERLCFVLAASKSRVFSPLKRSGPLIAPTPLTPSTPPASFVAWVPILLAWLSALPGFWFQNVLCRRLAPSSHLDTRQHGRHGKDHSPVPAAARPPQKRGGPGYRCRGHIPAVQGHQGWYKMSTTPLLQLTHLHRP